MKTISSVTCPVCGTFCDDIQVVIKKNTIIKVKNACGMGEAKFLSVINPHHRILKPLIRKNDELIEASFEEVVKKSAQILADAKYPILYGWSNTSCEAISVGLELAEEIGGVIDNTTTICHGPSILGIHDAGISTCTLGQIRHRADLIIYWGSNPWSAHPRHIERYTGFAKGKFRKSIWRRYIARVRSTLGEKKLRRASQLIKQKDILVPPVTGLKLPPPLFETERKMIVVDVRRTRSAEIADYFIQVEPNKDYELMHALIMLINEQDLEIDKVAGIPVELLEEIVDVITGCEFGVLFFGVGLTMSRGKERNIEAALRLVRALNSRTKYVIMPMRGHFNVTGANMVFTWQTGYPYAVDFSEGYPRYNPGETSVIDILSRDESDAALIVASDPLAHFPKKAAQNLAKNPLIVIDPAMTPTAMMADVVIPSAVVGIECEGTAYRMDGVPLPLKKIVNPPQGIRPDEIILKRILREIRRIKRCGGN